MKDWIKEMTGTNLGILGMILIGLYALYLAAGVVHDNRDPEVIKAALVIAAIAGSVVTLLGGFIGGYLVGSNKSANAPVAAPEKPIIHA